MPIRSTAAATERRPYFSIGWVYGVEHNGDFSGTEEEARKVARRLRDTFCEANAAVSIFFLGAVVARWMTVESAEYPGDYEWELVEGR